MTPAARPGTPAQAWEELRAGNLRFVEDRREHPNQGISHRHELVSGQAPFATFFGCGDSRVASEVIFDQGLGDLFVVRTAGHVVDSAVLGSLEFATEVLAVPLIVVLGHDSCGAISAALKHFQSGGMPHGYIRDIVERVTPSIIAARDQGATTTDEVEAEHVRQTMELILDRSNIIARAVEDGRCAVIGLTYALSHGRATMVAAKGLPLD